MKIICISDTHNRHRELNLPSGDLLIHAGDFTDFGRPDEITDFINWFSQLDYTHKILIAGNHDLILFPSLVNQLDGNKNFIYLENKGIVIDGIQFYGSPHTLSYGVKTLDWTHIPNNTDILITHTPPFEIGDSIRNKGCINLKQRVLEIKPKYHIFGHIHDGYGEYNQNGVETLFINVALQNDVALNKPISFFYNTSKK